MARRRRRGLTEDDLSAWAEASRTMRPMNPDRRFLTPVAAPPAVPSPNPKQAERPPLAPFSIGQAAGAGARRHDLAPTITQRLAETPVRMDRKTFGKLKRGKLKPARKLDLHGMTLAAAHPALVRFILDAHADGLRLVIVVTGKGRRRETDGPIPEPTGLLRHHVPGWLQAPPLGPLVLQLTDAHQRHGGSGAYYVYLRRGR